MQKFDVAAYIWPAYTGDEPRTRLFWEEGIGEWQTVKNQKRKACGYLWDRKPLWGYCNEADPYVMSMQIDAAADHGVNVFIYDWYWYDNRPFLENCLNDGFLKGRASMMNSTSNSCASRGSEPVCSGMAKDSHSGTSAGYICIRYQVGVSTSVKKNTR